MADEDWIDREQRKKAQDKALERANAAPQRPRSRPNTSSVSSYVAGALSRAVDNITMSATRNNTANAELFNLGQLVGAGVLDRQLAEDTVADACRRAGLPEREIRKLLRDDANSGLSQGISRPRDMSLIQDNRPPLTMISSPPPPPRQLTGYVDVEDGFWTSRKSLQDIYLASLARMSSPWAVLACCAARALATVRPHITLPDLIGGPGSLNWFAALTAESGGGKGAASSTARMLVSELVRERNTGSGEGMIKAFVRPKTDDEPAGLWESIMFMVDEIDSLTAQTKRSGATTMSVLRSAFSGEALGFSYVNTNTPCLDAHTYRMTMAVSIQPGRAADLMADAEGGTPQRFMWFPSTDSRITAELAGGYVAPLQLPKPGEWMYPMEVQIPSTAKDLILRERVKAMNGRTDALDGHALFVREKFSFALAVLDGRTAVSEEDWELSGIAAKVSDVTRGWVADRITGAQEEEATKRGRLQGVSQFASHEEVGLLETKRWLKKSALVIKWLESSVPQGLTRRDITRRLGEAYRMADPLLNELISSGAIWYDNAEKRYKIGDSS